MITETANDPGSEVVSWIVLALGGASVPFLLILIALFLGWRYRERLEEEMRKRKEGKGAEDVREAPPLEPATSDLLPDGPRLIKIEQNAEIETDSTMERDIKAAGDSAACFRVAYLIATLTYAAFSTFLFSSSVGNLPINTRVMLPYLILAPQLVVIGWFVGISRQLWLRLSLGYILLGGILAVSTGAKIIQLVVLASALSLCPLAGLFILRAQILRPFLVALAAGLLYSGGVMIVCFFLMPDLGEKGPEIILRNPWLVVVGLVNIPLGFLIAAEVLRLPKIEMRVAAAAALVILSVLGSGAVIGEVPMILFLLAGTAGNAIGMLVTWLVFRLFLWLFEGGRLLTPEILDAHFCWIYMTLYFSVIAWGVEARPRVDVMTSWYAGWLIKGLLLSFMLYFLILHSLLVRLRCGSKEETPRRLLLLRVFGEADARADLLDVLDDTWRRIGPVDLIVGSDVASRTLRASMLESFLLRRTSERFLRSSDEVAARLSQLRSEVEADGRYALNGVFCYEEAWQEAFARLEKMASAVLMDVRGFTSEKEGCAWELRQLVKHALLERVVLLGDGTTNETALKREAGRAWSDLSSDSPGSQNSPPRLRLLNFTRWSEEEKTTLFKLLLSASPGGSQAASNSA